MRRRVRAPRRKSDRVEQPDGRGYTLHATVRASKRSIVSRVARPCDARSVVARRAGAYGRSVPVPYGCTKHECGVAARASSRYSARCLAAADSLSSDHGTHDTHTIHTRQHQRPNSQFQTDLHLAQSPRQALARATRAVHTPYRARDSLQRAAVVPNEEILCSLQHHSYTRSP